MRNYIPKRTLLTLAAMQPGLLFAACSGSHLAQTVPPGAQPGDLTLEPCQFKLDDGEVAAECGVLVVAENRAKPNSRLIALPVIRIRATSAHPTEPIFFLEGGPGQSNLKFKPSAALLVNHDVVLVGYRGVDGSALLDCPEVKRVIKGVSGDALGEESLAQLGRAFQTCAERLQREGVDLAGYTILEVIADLEAVRLALGYERVHLLSRSYGTRIAQLYARQHPDRVYRSIMVGVNPPGRFVWEPGTIDAQLEYYARLWARDPKQRARTPNLAETIRNVAHNMPRRWLLLPIDPGKVRMMAFVMCFHRNTAAMVFDAFVATEQGDPSGLALMSLAYDFIVSTSFIWGDLVAKAYSADFDPQRDYLTELDPPHSILGSPLAKALWYPAQAGAWPIAPLSAELRQMQPMETETLLVSGSIDFSTPAEFAAQELLPHLPKGKQVILAEMGHINDIWQLQPQATERLLTSFFDTGVADDSLYTYAPTDFQVTWGFPRLAKLGLGVLFLLVAAVVGGLRWIRRHKGDKQL